MHHAKAILVAAATALISSVDAHMVMTKPAPFGVGLNNSPLAADGSDFPCKQRPSVYDPPSTTNTMAIGAPQTLAFMGSAVHGGGSCQVSLTTDKAPTKDSKWQVIHSIEGGCPAKDTQGNLGDDANMADPFTYTFTVPQGIAAGDYTLAWTWFNKVGNREMYMNCAPVTVTGGSKKRDVAARRTSYGFTKRDSFPGMFLANIGNGCSTADSADLAFPDPGTSVDKFGTSALTPPIGSCGASGSSSSSPPSGGGSPSPASSAPAVAASSAAPAVSPVETPTVASPVSSPESTPDSAPSPAAGSPSAGSGSGSGAMSGACSSEGMWNCLGGTSFQRCASGAWSVAQPMPAGTTCSAGQSQELAMNAA